MKRGAFLAAKIGVSLALLIYLLSTTDLSALERRVRSGDVLLFATAVVLYGGMLALSTWRWRLLLHALGFPARLRDLTSSYLVATFFNNFLPSNIGGDVVRVRDSSKLTGSTAASLAVVAVDRILGLGALYLLAFLAFAGTAQADPPSGGTTTSGNGTPTSNNPSSGSSTTGTGGAGVGAPQTAPSTPQHPTLSS